MGLLKALGSGTETPLTYDLCNASEIFEEDAEDWVMLNHRVPAGTGAALCR